MENSNHSKIVTCKGWSTKSTSPKTKKYNQIVNPAPTSSSSSDIIQHRESDSEGTKNLQDEAVTETSPPCSSSSTSSTSETLSAHRLVHKLLIHIHAGVNERGRKPRGMDGPVAWNPGEEKESEARQIGQGRGRNWFGEGRKASERERKRPTDNRWSAGRGGRRHRALLLCYSVMCLMFCCFFCCTRVGRERQGRAQESKFWAMAGTRKLTPATEATTQTHNARSLPASLPRPGALHPVMP